MIHVPHSSRFIPDNVRQGLLLSDAELEEELDIVTDHYTDILAYDVAYDIGPCVDIWTNYHSRLVVDVEKMPDDREILSGVGMGAIYTSTHDLKPLRNFADPLLMPDYYIPYVTALSERIHESLEDCNQLVLIDLHSYPSDRLEFEIGDENLPRPEVCLGTGPSTPGWLIDMAKRAFQGFDVAENIPFSGAYVPPGEEGTAHFYSLTIKIRRDVYMHEGTLKLDNGSKSRIVHALSNLISGIIPE